MAALKKKRGDPRRSLTLLEKEYLHKRESTQVRAYCLDVWCHTAAVAPAQSNGSLSLLILIAAANKVQPLRTCT